MVTIYIYKCGVIPHRQQAGSLRLRCTTNHIKLSRLITDHRNVRRLIKDHRDFRMPGVACKCYVNDK